MSRAAMEAQQAEIAAWHAEKRRWYPVREDGTRVNHGDEIISFRGERYRFDLVTDFPSASGVGKIAVARADAENASSNEYYVTVFNLTLKRETE